MDNFTKGATSVFLGIIGIFDILFYGMILGGIITMTIAVWKEILKKEKKVVKKRRSTTRRRITR